MDGRLVLKCYGVRLGPLTLPSFDVRIGNIVALVDPVEFGPSLTEIMHVLAGDCQTQGIELFAPAEVIAPQYEGAYTTDSTVSQILTGSGLTMSDISDVLGDLRLNTEAFYSELQLTQKVRLGLRLAFLRRAGLVVFTTAGLDPSGIEAVLKEIKRHVETCSAIHVISAGLYSFYESLGMHDRTVSMTQSPSPSATEDST